MALKCLATQGLHVSSCFIIALKPQTLFFVPIDLKIFTYFDSVIISNFLTFCFPGEVFV